MWFDNSLAQPFLGWAPFLFFFAELGITAWHFGEYLTTINLEYSRDVKDWKNTLL